VAKSTEDIFDDQFFTKQDVVTNALDNVKARRYVDARCVTTKTPLIDGGTVGPKGHVQVILPDQTTTYGLNQDAEDVNEIPHCTLKMFPEKTLHCVEFAKDKFQKIFGQKPKGL
jgi:molybdopterin/thiamine biosynthesis adenylyltransferase